MSRLSNCIYRAHSSSKFIMKSLLRFPPWNLSREGETKCKPCLCYERCFGRSYIYIYIVRASAAIDYIFKISRRHSARSRELVEKLFALAPSLAGRREIVNWYGCVNGSFVAIAIHRAVPEEFVRNLARNNFQLEKSFRRPQLFFFSFFFTNKFWIRYIRERSLTRRERERVRDFWLRIWRFNISRVKFLMN